MSFTYREIYFRGCEKNERTLPLVSSHRDTEAVINQRKEKSERERRVGLRSDVPSSLLGRQEVTRYFLLSDAVFSVGYKDFHKRIVSRYVICNVTTGCLFTVHTHTHLSLIHIQMCIRDSMKLGLIKNIKPINRKGKEHKYLRYFLIVVKQTILI